MKRTLLYIWLAVFALTGCTKEFDSINTNPNASAPTNFNADYFLSGSQWNYINGITGYNGAILFQSGWAQIFASTSSGAATITPMPTSMCHRARPTITRAAVSILCIKAPGCRRRS
jgi:hypothetical protein